MNVTIGIIVTALLIHVVYLHHKLLRKVRHLMASIDDLITEVAAEKTVIDSVVTFIQGLQKQLADILTGVTLPPATQAKVDQLFTDIGAASTELSNAIVTPPTP